MSVQAPEPWLAWMRLVDYPLMPNDGLHIRLARLEPGYGNTNLQLNVSAFLFDQAPPYEALSYAWLAHWKLPLRVVHINNKPCQIPINIVNFLRQRRSFSNAVYLWIDALCINQIDDCEKIKQIGLMPEIYGSCTSLNLWLGIGSLDTHFAFDFFHKLSSSAAQRPSFWADLGLDIYSYGRIKEIFKRPWWNRLWIVQEVAYGGSSRNLREARVMCGEDIISWGRLVEAIQKIKPDPSDGLVTSLERARKRVASWKEVSSDQSWTFEDDCTFLVLFEENVSRKCSEERDRIFAILNLVGPKKHFKNTLPDFRLSAHDVYLRVSDRVDIANRQFEAERISQAKNFAFLHETPATALFAHSCWGSSSVPPYPLEPQDRRIPFAALSNLERDITFSRDFSKMTVKGILIDQLVQTIHIPNGCESVDLSKVRKAYLESVTGRILKSRINEEVLFWRTIFFDHLDFEGAEGGNGSEEILFKGARRWFQETSQEYREKRCYRGTCPFCTCLIGNILCDTDSHIDYTLDPFGRTAEPRLKSGISKRVKDMLLSRSLFITPNGLPVIGPEGAGGQTPVYVALLAGLEVPVLLAALPNQPSGFRIIGEAFIHGYMYGEMFQRQAPGSGASTSVILEDINLIARPRIRI